MISFKQTKSINFDRIHDNIKRRAEDKLREELPLIVAEIKQRTSKGVDVDGKPFEKYSPRYAQYKKKLGLPSTPNLRLTGEMLTSIKTMLITENTKVIGIIEIVGAFAQKKSEWNQSGNLNPVRRFMGLDKTQIGRLKKTFKNFFK